MCVCVVSPQGKKGKKGSGLSEDQAALLRAKIDAVNWMDDGRESEISALYIVDLLVDRAFEIVRNEELTSRAVSCRTAIVIHSP